jgi:Arc/MetJ family transcription regulator
MAAKQFLALGKRNAVDQALRRLVASGKRVITKLNHEGGQQLSRIRSRSASLPTGFTEASSGLNTKTNPD